MSIRKKINVSKPTHIKYGYAFVCKKEACLRFEKTKVADKEGWIYRATQQIQQEKEELEGKIKSLINFDELKSKELLNKTFSDEEHPYRGVIKSILALDTLARAGYGHRLETQTELSNYLKKLSKWTKLSDNKKALNIVNEITNLHRENNNEIPIEPINQPVGLGNPVFRHKALNAILERDYLSPGECRSVEDKGDD